MNPIRRRIYRAKVTIRHRWDRIRAPWPIVGECHQSHRPEHACRQCDDSHRHVWRAWPDAPDWVGGLHGTPIRCTDCGGRKCDHENCDLQRHGHRHEQPEKTFIVNLRERPATSDISAAVHTIVRPWFDELEADGYTLGTPTFNLTPDPIDHWTTRVHATVEATR